MAYRHLNDNGVDQWVKSILSLKGSPHQHEFLKHVTEDHPADFVEYVESKVAGSQSSAYKDPDGEVPSLLDQHGQPIITMTPGHMYMMPAKDFLKLYDHWRVIPYGEAACPTLWGSITLAEIKAERIRPVWLAADRGGKEESSRKEIDQARRNQDAKKIDRYVRRCLRWMTAPSRIRGAPGLYGNCSLAKAWWCGHFSYECEKVTGIKIEDTSKAIKEIWLGATDYLAGKLTVISEPNVVAGISLWANNQIRSNKTLTRQEVEHTCRTLGEISSSCVLGLQDVLKIEEAIFAFTEDAKT